MICNYPASEILVKQYFKTTTKQKKEHDWSIFIFWQFRRWGNHHHRACDSPALWWQEDSRTDAWFGQGREELQGWNERNREGNQRSTRSKADRNQSNRNKISKSL